MTQCWCGRSCPSPTSARGTLWVWHTPCNILTYTIVTSEQRHQRTVYKAMGQDALGRCPKTSSHFYDINNLVAFGQKQSWRPPAANRVPSEFNDVVAFGHNQLWRPLAAKFRLWFQENYYVICEQPHTDAKTHSLILNLNFMIILLCVKHGNKYIYRKRVSKWFLH